jgi:hypothetical protein
VCDGQDYKHSFIYWDSIVMLRKLAMVLAVVFLGPVGQQVQVLVLLIILLVSIRLQVGRWMGQQV